MLWVVQDSLHGRELFVTSANTMAEPELVVDLDNSCQDSIYLNTYQDIPFLKFQDKIYVLAFSNKLVQTDGTKEGTNIINGTKFSLQVNGPL